MLVKFGFLRGDPASPAVAVHDGAGYHVYVIPVSHEHDDVPSDEFVVYGTPVDVPEPEPAVDEQQQIAAARAEAAKDDEIAQLKADLAAAQAAQQASPAQEPSQQPPTS
jgi:hypothetical protein